MNFYKRHIGDYLKDTSHLSLLEHGIYSRLLDVYYTREVAIPSETVARLIGARSKEEIRALNTVLTEFFDLRDGLWHQARCEEEISAANDKAEKNRSVGKLGGRPRKSETKQVIKNNHDGFQTEPKNNPSQTPDSRHQEPTTAPRLVTEGGQKPENPAPLEIANLKITPHGAMAIELSKRGVAITSMNPDLLDWIEKGVTIPQACEAIALARQKKPEPERISAGYLNTIIHGEIINPKQKKPSGPAWWTSDSATNAKASELGLAANRGEEMSQFRDRIRKSLENKTRGVAA